MKVNNENARIRCDYLEDSWVFLGITVCESDVYTDGRIRSDQRQFVRREKRSIDGLVDGYDARRGSRQIRNINSPVNTHKANPIERCIIQHTRISIDAKPR